VAESNGLHSFMHSAAHRPPDLGGDCGTLLSWWLLGLLGEGEQKKDHEQREGGLESVG
jgi:hypothetical protein